MRRRAAVAGAVLAALAAAVAAVALAGGGSGDAAEPRAAAAAAGTGTVARRTLAERVTIEGTIGYAGETTVLARLSGTVTALPAVGDVIRRGERLYALAGEPVLLMYGAVPAYRDLGEGISDGEDVEQLERNLAALGYEPGTVDEAFTSTTAAAVVAWQDDVGLEETGEVELGRVAFLRGPQRVTELETTLGESLGGGGGGSRGMVAWEPAAAEGPPPVEEKPGAGKGPAASENEAPEDAEEADEAEAAPAEGEATKPGAEPEPPIPETQADPDSKAAPKGQAPPEAQAAPEAQAPPEGQMAPSRQGGEPGPEPGSGAESEPPSTPVLRTSSTQRVVSVELDPDQQSIAHRGQRVGVLLPGGEEARGKVSRLTAVESADEGNPVGESETALEATIAVTGKHRIPALDGASVSVLFTQRVRKDVLSVPLTALVAIGGERFAVYVREGSARRQIVVTPGLAADGFVEVRGQGLEAGMTVEAGG